MEKTKFPKYRQQRFPLKDRKLLSEERLKIKTYGKDEFSIAKNTVILRGLEQLIDEEQTRALGYIIKLLEERFDGERTIIEAVDQLEKLLAEKGPEALSALSSLAVPRRQEIFACINRYRGLRVLE